MAFNFGNKPKAVSFELIPEGDYEVFVEKAEERPTRSGRMQLSIQLRIREDVEQSCQNRILFLNIFQKTPEKLNDMDKQVGNYNYTHLYHLLDMTYILVSENEFETMNDICRLLIGKELRVTVHHEVWNGKISEKIDQLKGVYESDADNDNPISVGQSLDSAHGSSYAYQANPSPTYAPPPVPFIPSYSIQDFEEIISDKDLPF